MLLSETSHLGKQSLLVRGKKRNKWTPCQHRPKRHLLPSKVSESLRNHQSVLFLKGDYCFRIKMERNASTLYPTHLQFNSFMQNSDRRLKFGTEAVQGGREELVSSFTDQISWQFVCSQQLTASKKCRITTPGFQLRIPKWYVEYEKHQIPNTDMRSFNHQRGLVSLKTTQAGIHFSQPLNPLFPVSLVLRYTLRLRVAQHND